MPQTAVTCREESITAPGSHSMDHTLAVWALGGSPEAVAEVYKSHDYTEPVHPSPEPITDTNFPEHLGDAK